MDTNAMIGKGRHDRAEEREYRFYTILLFPLAFAAVCLRRAFFATRSFAGAPRRSFFGEVIELNRSTVPWIFMGR